MLQGIVVAQKLFQWRDFFNLASLKIIIDSKILIEIHFFWIVKLGKMSLAQIILYLTPVVNENVF